MIDKTIYIEKKDGTKIPVLFSFNVLEKLQEVYGSYNSWLHSINGEEKTIDEKGNITWNKTGETNLKALRFGLTEAINEGIDVENENLKEDEKRSFFSEKQVGRIITEIGLAEANKSMQQAVIESQGQKENTEEGTDEERKN